MAEKPEIREIARRSVEVARDRDDLSPAQLRDFTEKPLRAIPDTHAALKPIAWKFWGMWQHLIPSQLGLALRLRDWIERDGLTIEEAREAFDTINRPDRAVRIQFAGTFFSELTGVVGLIVQRRRAAEETEARRTEATEGERARETVRTLAAGMFEGRI